MSRACLCLVLCHQSGSSARVIFHPPAPRQLAFEECRSLDSPRHLSSSSHSISVWSAILSRHNSLVILLLAGKHGLYPVKSVPIRNIHHADTISAKAARLDPTIVCGFARIVVFGDIDNDTTLSLNHFFQHGNLDVSWNVAIAWGFFIFGELGFGLSQFLQRCSSCLVFPLNLALQLGNAAVLSQFVQTNCFLFHSGLSLDRPFRNLWKANLLQVEPHLLSQHEPLTEFGQASVLLCLSSLAIQHRRLNVIVKIQLGPFRSTRRPGGAKDLHLIRLK
mmetsp:Transcript_17454/g.38074  ORF Transcript_17454/g.38074 Transcript_17454/m.38074 type:complete len:277 (-) Transcript_17454:490-1320(-)